MERLRTLRWPALCSRSLPLGPDADVASTQELLERLLAACEARGGGERPHRARCCGMSSGGGGGSVPRRPGCGMRRDIYRAFAGVL